MNTVYYICLDLFHRQVISVALSKGECMVLPRMFNFHNLLILLTFLIRKLFCRTVLGYYDCKDHWCYELKGS